MASSFDQTCGEVEFTRELSEALLHEKFDDDKRDGKELAKYVKDLENCTMKWHEKKISYLLEDERLRSLLDLAEKKCTDADSERKNKVDGLDAISSHLRQRITTLEEELAKIESEKMASELEDDFNKKLEYNRSLQEYNSELEIDFRTLNEASKRAEMERSLAKSMGI
ncbi:PREDICTED: kinesin-5-like [Fragaria vesca subsp. vesca]